MIKFVLGSVVASLAMAMSVAAEENKAPTAKSLDGTWTVVCYEKDGRPQAEAGGMAVKAEGGIITCSGKDGKASLTFKVVFGPNGTVQVTEGTGDAAASASTARAGVYVLTQNFLAISVNEEIAPATSARPTDGQAGKARCNVILKREAPRPGGEK